MFVKKISTLTRYPHRKRFLFQYRIVIHLGVYKLNLDPNIRAFKLS